MDKDPEIDSFIEDDAEVLAELAADGLDGEFDGEGNPVATRDLGFLDARGTKTKGDLIYAAAAKQLGTPYKFAGGDCAGKTHGGFDCSGLLPEDILLCQLRLTKYQGLFYMRCARLPKSLFHTMQLRNIQAQRVASLSGLINVKGMLYSGAVALARAFTTSVL